MKSFLGKIHLAGVVGLLTTAIGILGDPAVIGFIPHPWSMRIALAGALIQAATRAVNKGDVKEIPKHLPVPELEIPPVER